MEPGEFFMPAVPSHVSPWTKEGTAGASLVVKSLKNSRTRSMVPLPPVGLPTARVPTEIPSLDGQDVGSDYDEDLSANESWSAVETDSEGDEEGKKGADASSGGYPAGDLPKTSPRPLTAKSLEFVAFAAAMVADAKIPPR